jgi:hypothetical protein
MSSPPQRHNFKWNINELLSLQREYQLLEMTIQDISDKHGRTVVSVLYKLQQEGFIETWIDARGYQEFSKTQKYLVGSLDSGEKLLFVVGSVIEDEDEDEDSDSDYVEEELEEDEDLDSDYVEEELEEDEDELDDEENSISSLNQRVWGLETAVNDIKSMIGTLLSKFNTSSKPLKKLRQSQVSENI